MAKPLVIVESPAKARTIAGFLGGDFDVESSIGHIRDLPRGAAEVPDEYRGESWARLGVDPDNDFKPVYVVSHDRRAHVDRLKKMVRKASELYLATDEDREGESIAWHLMEVLAPTVPVKRMVFHEITREAISRAVDEWRELDRRLVDAQEARRILDRLYGYEVSPVLWKKVMPKLSAGRVQSVATRMVVERERQRMRFRAGSWWNVEADCHAAAGGFPATLASVGGRRLATGKDFDEQGALTKRDVLLLDEANAHALVAVLAAPTTAWHVSSVEEKPFKRSPAAPFMTSTLQQEAGRKLRFSAARAMRVAQHLYEEGWISYMRTDSTTLSSEAVTTARRLATDLYGAAAVSAHPRTYTSKVKNAQEAHEAIRPAGESWRGPGQAAAALGADEARLYELIWQRTLASQMTDARGLTVQVRVAGHASDGVEGLPGGPSGPTEAELYASGKVITHPGFLAVYEEGSDEANGPETSGTGANGAGQREGEARLPPLATGDPVEVHRLTAKAHATQPPARYTEASLVKAMEELGIGRPSTYASIIDTIQQRGYVWKKGSALVPSFTAFAVVALLEQHFAHLVDYGFTAAMEDDLDGIAQGDEEMVPWLARFYFGNGEVEGLKHAVEHRLGVIDAREINSIPIGVDAAGKDIVVRVGRYGPYVERGEDRATLPDALPPDELCVDAAEALLSAPSGDRALGEDPETGLPVLARAGRFGPYVQLGEGGEGKKKPRTSSLLATMALDTVTLEDALRLLSLPRTVGHDADGIEIVAANGRYGAYIKRGTDTRSLPSEESLFSVTEQEALALLAEPKRSRFARPAAPPLVELGPDPGTGRPMVVRSGRYGPYVTDGETNASLRTGDHPESLSPERAAELLADRRAAGPPAGRRRAAKRKAPAKKVAAKKVAAKKAAKRKAPAKKVAAKKVAAKKAAKRKAPAKKVAAKKAAAKKAPAKKTPVKRRAAAPAAPPGGTGIAAGA